LESGIDSVFVENGRILRPRPDANAYSPFSHTDTYAYSPPHTDANTNAESRPGMQRDSDLDSERDLHWRPAREPERLHL